MRKISVLLFILLFLPDISIATPPRYYERSLKRNSKQKYLVHVPQHYNPKETYPLFIAIHRRGGPATDQCSQWSFFTNRDRYILLCPQFFSGYEFFRSDEDKKLISMMHEIKSEFKYDPEMVFIVGSSVGADFVQKFAFKYSGRVHAVGLLDARNFSDPPFSGKGRDVRYFVAAGPMNIFNLDKLEQFLIKLKGKSSKVEYKEFFSAENILSEDVKNAFMEFLKDNKE